MKKLIGNTAAELVFGELGTLLMDSMLSDEDDEGDTEIEVMYKISLSLYKKLKNSDYDLYLALVE